MFRVFGYDCDCFKFDFFVENEDQARKFEEDNGMCVVFYEEADADAQRVIHISKKVGVGFISGKTIHYYLTKAMDRMEGKEMYANDMLFLVNYRNELMEKNSDY